MQPRSHCVSSETLACTQELFKKHIAHIQKKKRSNKINVQKGFYSKQAMKDNLKWKPCKAQNIKLSNQIELA